MTNEALNPEMSFIEDVQYERDQIFKHQDRITVRTNIILQSRTQLKSTWAIRMLAYLSSVIKPEDVKRPNTLVTYIVDIKDVLSFTSDNLLSNPWEMAKNIESASKQLVQCGIQIPATSLDNYDWRYITLINSATKIKGTTLIEYKFDPDMLLYLCDINKGYKLESLQELFSLKSIYSQKIYELLLSWQGIEKDNKAFDYTYLLNFLDVKKSMRSFGAFKAKILDPALNEINSKTSLKLEYKQFRVGKKTEKIGFIYLEKTDYNDRCLSFNASQFFENKTSTKTTASIVSFVSPPVSEGDPENPSSIDLGPQILNLYNHYFPDWSPVKTWTDSYAARLLRFNNAYPESKTIKFWDNYFKVQSGKKSFREKVNIKHLNLLIKTETYKDITFNNAFYDPNDIIRDKNKLFKDNIKDFINKYRNKSFYHIKEDKYYFLKINDDDITRSCLEEVILYFTEGQVIRPNSFYISGELNNLLNPKLWLIEEKEPSPDESSSRQER